MAGSESTQQDNIHTLYSDHHRWLYVWLRKRLSNSADAADLAQDRSEEHTSELQSLMRISYAVFCLKKNKKTTKELIHILLSHNNSKMTQHKQQIQHDTQ